MDLPGDVVLQHEEDCLVAFKRFALKPSALAGSDKLRKDTDTDKFAAGGNSTGQ